MEKISVEQSIYGQTYRPAVDAQAKKQTNLGGYAFSFEDLLQRVGARLDKAFSAADSSHGLVANKDDKAPPRDDAPRKAANDTRRDRPQSRSADNSDSAADARSRSDAGSRDDNGSSVERRDNDKPDYADNDAKDSKRSRDGKEGESDKSTADNNNDGGENTQTADNGDGKNADQAQAGDQAQDAAGAANTATGQQTAVNQVAAIYAAGILGAATAGQEKSATAEQGQQAGKAAQAAQDMAGQVAAQASGKTAKGSKPNTHEANSSQANAAAIAAAQAAQKAGANKTTDTIQNQAQKLAQAMGGDKSADVKVTVTDTAAQLTSKPTQTIANASILTPDEGSQPKGGQQQTPNGQQQGNNGQTAAQAQAAMLQMAQATAQSGNVQAQSGGGNSFNTAGGGTGLQATGGALHGTGGLDTMNSTQTPGGAQQAQQAALTKESAPTHQAQQAQRELPGNSVADQISVKITKALQTGTDRISIQLKPAELGRIDVKLEMTHDGRVMTVVTAEKQETLDLLRRDASELQKALADAGLQNGDMEFNLKGQEKKTAEDGEGKGNGDGALAEADSEQTDPESAVLTAWESGILMNGRLDMRA